MGSGGFLFGNGKAIKQRNAGRGARGFWESMEGRVGGGGDGMGRGGESYK